MANPNQPLPRKSSFADKVGNALEKLGHKLSDMGAGKLGQKIHDAGDKMEKSHDNPDHPHKV
ncbi:hypothetical protein ACES2L_01070 [Bdellovibrio bacteriovorus]|uniref:Antitoxin n=1 Tax=Bdellovibrio reynosensis TaxID=2835041 RepID=A0ABY4C8I0_9BACT|nr:hypothetical protein [Bdellovibrio reynosensis]UOF00197.1 hypothetical protein MNR06_10835 [Bdellovibrio reynosensis]